MEFNCEEVNKDWLCNSLFERVKEHMKFFEVKEAMIVEGLLLIKTRYLGDNLVLLSYNEGEKLSLIVEENQEWSSNFFVDIKPRNTRVAPRVRLV